MDVKEINIKDVKAYENNPRVNNAAVDYVAKSIKEFGFKVPIVIDKDNVIVTGHTRILAAEKLGLETVPAIVADDLTEEQIKAFRIADNKIHEFSHWDDEKLAAELIDLQNVDFDVMQFGFSDDQTETKTVKTGENEEISLDDFDDDSFNCECPNCGFRFNEVE